MKPRGIYSLNEASLFTPTNSTTHSIYPQSIIGTIPPSILLYSQQTEPPVNRPHPSIYPSTSIYLFQTPHQNAALMHPITSILVPTHIGCPASRWACRAEKSTRRVPSKLPGDTAQWFRFRYLALHPRRAHLGPLMCSE